MKKIYYITTKHQGWVKTLCVKDSNDTVSRDMFAYFENEKDAQKFLDELKAFYKATYKKYNGKSRFMDEWN